MDFSGDIPFFQGFACPEAQLLRQVVQVRNRFGYLSTYQVVASGRTTVVNPSGKGEDRPVIRGGQPGRDKPAALRLRLDQDGGSAEARDDAVPPDEMQGQRGCPGRVVGDQPASRGGRHVVGEGTVTERIYAVDAGGHHPDGGQPAFEGGPVGDAVGSERQSADDPGPAATAGEGHDDPLAPFRSVGTDVPGPDDGYGGTVVEQVRQGGTAADIQAKRRVFAFPQQGGIIFFAIADEPEAVFPDPFQAADGIFQRLRGQPGQVAGRARDLPEFPG